ncbi:hypothetical protein [Bifidobacterium ruminantium]|uniref:Uncharacterized protein n=1 Tax=Bifidobacterium ruminantium TaxID=78346 RepID=A0A087CU42_BIFRU|nr:hypothetical protein [Bifidobacterium ruminantium]KFI86792.1 hypothetical protein BRUM_1706 [Bifidobacterium ruminantium]
MDVLVQDEGEKGGSDDEVWSWCPVANVVDAHETGQDHHIMHGTKIFSAGTKVYISSEWADTRTIGGSFKVIGRARKSHRLVCAWLRWDRMENVRLRRVFSPAVLRIMARMSRQTGEVDPSGFVSWWGNSNEDRDGIIRRFGLKEHE